MIGRTVGHYEITALLGKGGMAEVYRARDTRLHRDVALKILPNDFGNDPERLQRFQRESRAASALSHPNLAHIYDVGTSDGVSFYAMELIEGETLAKRLATGPMPEKELLRIAAQISDALAALHEADILHRDLKPANILIDTRGDVKIVDFGLAKRVSTQDAADATTELATQAGTVMGTLHYMSPEQARGDAVDARSDLFSLGVILYEASTGLKPFNGKSAVEVLTALATFEPAPVSTHRKEISSEFVRIVHKCLHKDAGMRYASARDLYVDLNNLRTPSTSGARSPQVAPSRARNFRRGLPITIGIVLGIVALVISEKRFTSGATIASVAVLPFANATQASDMNYLCDGLAEGLINTLAQNQDLRVISRASSFRFRNQDADLASIGKALGVEAVVLGRLTAQGDEVSVSAELVDVRDNRQIWGGKYSQPNQDILTLETELARAIHDKLRPSTAATTTAITSTHRPSADPEAYRLYLQGREYLVGTQVEMDKGIELLEMAIARRPDYALAHCALAEAHLLQAAHGAEGADEALAAARAALSEALAIEPNLAEAYSLLGYVAMYYDWDWQRAESYHQKAIQLNPNSLVAILNYCEFYTVLGRWSDSIALSLGAKKIDPLSTRAAHWYAFSLLGDHQFDLAAAEFQNAIDLNPNWVWGYIKMSKSLAHAGRFAEALAAARTADQKMSDGDTPLARAWIGGTYAMVGADSLAQDSLEKLLAMRDNPGSIEGPLAELYFAMGRTNEALDQLELAYENRRADAMWLLAMPDLFLPALRDEPRYRRLLRLSALDKAL